MVMYSYFYNFTGNLEWVCVCVCVCVCCCCCCSWLDGMSVGGATARSGRCVAGAAPVAAAARSPTHRPPTLSSTGARFCKKNNNNKKKNGEQRALSAVVGCSVGRAYYFVWLGLFSKVQSEFASLADENELIGLVWFSFFFECRRTAMSSSSYGPD